VQRITFYSPIELVKGRQLTLDDLPVNLMQAALSLVFEHIPSYESILQWTPLERLLVYDWTIREHFRASDNPYIKRRLKPSLLQGFK